MPVRDYPDVYQRQFKEQSESIRVKDKSHKKEIREGAYQGCFRARVLSIMTLFQGPSRNVKAWGSQRTLPRAHTALIKRTNYQTLGRQPRQTKKMD